MNDTRPWLATYPKGVPANIDADAYPTVVALLDEVLKKYKDKPAFANMGKEITFGDVDRLSRQFGAYLRSRGLEPGDRVALMMPNLLQYPIATFGALRAGMVLVNTNPLYTPREMLHQFTDSGAKAIVICENFASNLEKILKDTSIKTVILASIGEMLGPVKGPVVNFVVRRVKKMVPKFHIPNTVTFMETLRQGKKFTLTDHQGHPEDVVAFQYTGGTTGVSKGAMLTNRNFVANMQQMRGIINPILKEDEKAVSPLPLYHSFSFTVNGLTLMSLGALSILITNPRDLKTVMEPFKKYKVTIMTGVNTLFNALLNHPDFAALDFSALKLTVAGGAALQRSVAEKWQKVTGCPLTEGYGLTETSPVASVNPVDGSGKLGTIGLPAPSTDMRVVSEDGKVLKPNEIGEIQIKGPQVMKGYYNRPDETEKVLKDDWLLTGDIGFMHDDGYFQIVDRKKDMILVSGFNVYPNEIEEVLASHPKILEAAAIGLPDPKSTEVVKVFVVKKDESLTVEEVVAHCRENLTGYKVPKQVEFRKELPKTNVGKILRRVLKEEEMKKLQGS